jgi:hypothetical protein
MITIETINGREYTVIRKPFDAEWVREQLAMDNAVLATDQRYTSPKMLTDYYTFHEGYGKLDALRNTTFDGLGFCYPYGDDLLWTSATEFTETIVRLPPLPRRPKPEHAALLHLYISKGLMPLFNRLECINKKPVQTVRALNIITDWDRGEKYQNEYEYYACNILSGNGERVEIAIGDE